MQMKTAKRNGDTEHSLYQKDCDQPIYNLEIRLDVTTWQTHPPSPHLELQTQESEAMTTVQHPDMQEITTVKPGSPS